jgi:hypothetical protein
MRAKYCCTVRRTGTVLYYESYIFCGRNNYDFCLFFTYHRSMDCSGTVNSGVLYVRNTSNTQQMFSYMLDMKKCILDRSCGYEQDQVHKSTVLFPNITSCSLDPNLFTHRCMGSTFPYIDTVLPKTPISRLVTFHTSCVNGLKQKAMLMKQFESQVRLYPNRPLHEAIRSNGG